MSTAQQYHHQVNAQQSENDKIKNYGKIKLYIWKHILHELIQYSMPLFVICNYGPTIDYD